MDDWSEQGAKNIVAALESILGQRSSLRVAVLRADALPKETQVTLEETYQLFDAVDNAIVLHTYGPPLQRFDDKISNFDYSLGEEVKALHGGAADALLFVRAVDHVSTQGRIAQQTAVLLVAAALGAVIIPQGGVTVLSIALVDGETGSILWQKFARSEGFHDLRNPESTKGLLAGVLVDFPLR
jgi:hypothetical protein